MNNLNLHNEELVFLLQQLPMSKSGGGIGGCVGKMIFLAVMKDIAIAKVIKGFKPKYWMAQQDN